MGSFVPSCFSISFLSSDLSTNFFSWGCSPCIIYFRLVWSTSSVSTSLTTGGFPCTSSSLPLLKVKALTCSLPSLLRFISEFLGKEPYCLSDNRVAIWPICTSKFLNCVAWLFSWVDRFCIFAFVSFIKAVWEVSISASAYSKSTFFSDDDLLTWGGGILF